MKTLTVTIPASKNIVFNYLSDINNFPEWATEFCLELKQVDGKYKVLSPMGELFFDIEADRKTGVIDYCTSANGRSRDRLATRLLELPNGDSQYAVHLIQGEEMPDKLYERQLDSLQHELDQIYALFSQ